MSCCDTGSWLVAAVDAWTAKRDAHAIQAVTLILREGLGASTLCRTVVEVLGPVPVVFALPLDYGGKLRILRTLFIPAALHGAQESHISVGRSL